MTQQSVASAVQRTQRSLLIHKSVFSWLGALRAAAATVLLTFAVAAVDAAPAPADIDKAANAVEPQVLAWRHHLHQFPELSFQEFQTSKYIADALRTMPGMEVHTGLGGTGIKAVLKGGRPGPVVALRADMDALPIEEKNDLPFRSQATVLWQGKETAVMHACGHDTHVAMLLGAASILSGMRAQLEGTVVFLYQPAEEWGGQDSPSGAPRMIADGALDDPKVEVVFGQHIISNYYPGGAISYRSGVQQASADGLAIAVHGVGAAANQPWRSRDPVVTAAQIVTDLQSVVSRQTDLTERAAVVGVSQFNAGNRYNIIPEEATLIGVIRTLSERTRVQVNEAVTRMAQKVAEASGLTAEVKIQRGTPVLVNDPVLTARVLPALQRAAGSDRVREIPPVTASDDFAVFSSAVPGLYWFLNGSPYADRPGPPNHSPQFIVDETAFKVGVKALVHVTLEYMRSAKARVARP